MNSGPPITRSSSSGSEAALRRAVAWVAALNLLYFSVEFAVAVAIGSVSLFADSVDFLEDASLNVLVLLGLAWRPEQRARLGFALAGLLLVPGIATAWTAWQKFAAPVPPAPVALSLAGLGALVVNVTCAYLLARFRQAGGSLTRAAYLSARNDALANVAIIGAGAVTAVLHSAWPDLIVGLGIFALNLGAAHEVYHAAQRERRLGRSPS